MKLGEELKAMRQRAGWTQAEVASRCGLSVMTICRYERGNCIPRVGVINELTRIFGLPKHYLTKAREQALDTQALEKEHAGIKRFHRGNVIRHKRTSTTKWRVVNVHADGTLLVEKIVRPPRKIISRPEEYQIVQGGAV